MRIETGLAQIDLADLLLETDIGFMDILRTGQIAAVAIGTVRRQTRCDEGDRNVEEESDVRARQAEGSVFGVQDPATQLLALFGIREFGALVGDVRIDVTVEQNGLSGIEGSPHLRHGAVAVFSKKQGDQLRVHGTNRAEATLQETADQIAVDGGVIAGEMDVFEPAPFLEPGLEPRHLGGFSGPVKSFNDNQHRQFCIGVTKIFIFSVTLTPMQDYRIMGIVNLTGDSFYPPSRMLDGEGRLDRGLFLSRVRELAGKGASYLDLGACSTRPGSQPPPEEVEGARVEEALRLLQAEAPELLPLVSIDTYRSSVVRRALAVMDGTPFLVNDVSAGGMDPEMLPLVASAGLPYVAMHMRGTPLTMDQLCDYPDGVVTELHRYFEAFSEKAARLGIREWILDPGLGFAKTPAQCLELLENLPVFADLGRPILIGLSRKRLIAALGIPMDTLHRLAIERGASILRVHEIIPL